MVNHRPDSGDPRAWDPEATRYLPPTGDPRPQPGHDAPRYDTPGHAAPGYDASGAYDTRGYDAPGHGVPGYDVPAYDAPAYGAPAYGAPGYAPTTDSASASDATQVLPPTPAYDASASDATQFLPSTPAYETPVSDATQVLRPVPAHDPPASDATQVLPPTPAYGGPVSPADGADGYGPPPPAESTRPLPRVVDEPPPHTPRTTSRATSRTAPGDARRRGPSRVVLVGAAIAACAVLGLGIGAVLSGGDGDPAPAAAGTATAGSGATTGAPTAPAPAPTPSASATESRPPVPAGQFVLFDAATGRAVDVSAAATNDGAPVIVWERHAQANQQWLVADLGDGHVQIKAVHSGLCLQPVEPVGAGAAVVQRPCVDSDAQRWLPAPSADATTHTLTLKGWGLVLAPAGPENGAALSLQAPDPAAPHGWTLQPVA
ncbi:RICIN domain-containing protein [Streptomyces kanasensis]|uniref:RICIN domain-containing protein n=1 Tax=Streptomyces kanasensis TaxID=936756 RepID=UPI0036FD0E05